MAKRTEYNRQYRLANLERLKKRHREYRALERKQYPDKVRDGQLKAKFGLTTQQYEEKLIAQNGVCAICHRPERRKTSGPNVNKLSVDHNHQTGEIRDLLCLTCNVGLGHFDENPELLLAAIQYLERHNFETLGQENNADLRAPRRDTL